MEARADDWRKNIYERIERNMKPKNNWWMENKSG
jgi:hypothetical protein